MPRFKVFYPELVIEAPTEEAAVKAYNDECASTIKYLPMLEFSTAEPDMVVDAKGDVIEEEEE